MWESEGGGCPAAIASHMAQGIPADVRQAVTSGEFDERITGDRATVTPHGFGPWPLVKEGARWRLQSPQ